MGGLSGYGRCDDVEIEVISPDDDESWELQLSTAHAVFRFAIAGPEALGAIVRFLDAAGPGWAELEVGSMDRATVVFVHDPESGAPRFWFKALGDHGFLSLQFADDEARKLVAAIRDAHDDLVSLEPDT